MVFFFLPVVLRSHIPGIPFLQRSTNSIWGRWPYFKPDATVGVVTTPTIANSSPSALETHTPTSTGQVDTRHQVCEVRGSSNSLPEAHGFSDTNSGIDWSYAVQGINLLTQAYQASNTLANDNKDSSAPLARQLFLHGISYLLRSVPRDLTRDELGSLQTAMPPSVLKLQDDLHAPAPLLLHYKPTQNPSILQRITAVVVFQAFVLIQLILPYIKLFIGLVYRWEREHRVARGIVNRSIVAIDKVGRKSLRFSYMVCQMNDGKVGHALKELTMWWADGLARGIQQGISDGVVLVGGGTMHNPNDRVAKIDGRPG